MVNRSVLTEDEERFIVHAVQEDESSEGMNYHFGPSGAFRTAVHSLRRSGLFDVHKNGSKYCKQTKFELSVNGGTRAYANALQS